MQIANPIYDVVFKYLLDDEKVARLVLSALLGREVLELQFRPTEVQHEATKQDGVQLLVLRMDFAATVRLEDGSRKLVLIEIQKAHNATDVQRFPYQAAAPAALPTSVVPGGCGDCVSLPPAGLYGKQGKSSNHSRASRRHQPGPGRGLRRGFGAMHL